MITTYDSNYQYWIIENFINSSARCSYFILYQLLFTVLLTDFIWRFVENFRRFRQSFVVCRKFSSFVVRQLLQSIFTRNQQQFFFDYVIDFINVFFWSNKLKLQSLISDRCLFIFLSEEIFRIFFFRHVTSRIENTFVENNAFC